MFILLNFPKYNAVNLTIDLGNIILIIIVFQSVLFSLILLTYKGKKRASNFLLSLFLLTIACQFLFILLREAFNFHNYNGVRVIFAFAYGPLLYLYSESLIYEFFRPKFKYLIHFIPSFIALVCFFFNIPTKSFMAPILYVILICYITFAIVKIVKYRRVLVNAMSTTNQTDLKWLQWIMIIFILALIFDIVDYFFINTRVVFGISLADTVILFLINWIFFKGLKQPQIFLGISKKDLYEAQEIKNLNRSRVLDETAKYKYSSLSKEEMNIISIRIKELFESENLYLEPQLKIEELAKRLNVTRHNISQTINLMAQKPFYDFVNEYRVNHFKKLLTDRNNRKFTILALGIESGFNSKATLNRVFKQNIGQTPREYRRSHFIK